MYRRAAIVPVLAVTGFFMLGPRAEPSRQAPAQPPGGGVIAPSPPPPSVRLEHQIIEVNPAVRPRGVPPRARRAPSATRLAVGHAPPHGLVQRAKRAIVGDGRYRPEPFPRLASR